jgi:hypothetical protein
MRVRRPWLERLYGRDGLRPKSWAQDKPVLRNGGFPRSQHGELQRHSGRNDSLERVLLIGPESIQTRRVDHRLGCLVGAEASAYQTGAP